jgi:hypothetical protein
MKQPFSRLTIKLKPTYFTLLIYLCLLQACNNQTNQGLQKYTLHGEIKYQDTGIVVMTYNTNYKVITDTSEITDGKFLFTGEILEPTQATLRDGQDLELAVIYLESTEMNIYIIKEKFLESIMNG